MFCWRRKSYPVTTVVSISNSNGHKSTAPRPPLPKPPPPKPPSPKPPSSKPRSSMFLEPINTSHKTSNETNNVDVKETPKENHPSNAPSALNTDTSKQPQNTEPQTQQNNETVHVTSAVSTPNTEEIETNETTIKAVTGSLSTRNNETHESTEQSTTLNPIRPVSNISQSQSKAHRPEQITQGSLTHATVIGVTETRVQEDTSSGAAENLFLSTVSEEEIDERQSNATTNNHESDEVKGRGDWNRAGTYSETERHTANNNDTGTERDRSVKFRDQVSTIEDHPVNENSTQELERDSFPIARRRGVKADGEIDVDLKIKVHPKSEENKLHIKNAIAANEFLENILKGPILDGIVDAMYPREVNEGDIVIGEGDPGNHLYVSDVGTFEVYSKNKLVNTFSDKRVFGELAVLYNSKRMATIKAVTSGKIWVLHRKIYQQSRLMDAVAYAKETLSFLQNVPLVNKLSEFKLNKIASLLNKEFFRTETVIVQEGDEGDKFYVIRAGSVTVTKKGQGKVSELGKGAFFGERALLNSDRRQATVIADAPGVECLTLTRSEFLAHFDQKTLLSVDDDAKEREQSETSGKNATPTGEYSDIDLNQLQIEGTLGVGGFGRVELVQHKADKNLTFALKYLKKVDMVQQGQVTHVFSERDIQINCNSMFIARMYRTFQDRKYLYFLMESCLGGDLWTFLQKQPKKCVSDPDARFYASCVLEALAYLHARNYIYRDLKPENLLIDNQGYLKLTDFGFAKAMGSMAKTFTFAGTPEYVAPEIIYNKGHGKEVDYWAFGILIFELVVGKTPFRAGEDHMKTFNRILKGINSVQFPSQVKTSAQNLVLKLCRPIPNERLGAQINGIEDIRSHKWFQGFDWKKLREKKLKAPFVPKLSSNTDRRYFESFKRDDDIPPDEPVAFQSF